MRKCTLLLSLAALLAPVKSAAQAFIPQASTDNTVYEYYLQCAGSDDDYYVSTAIGSTSNSVELTTSGDMLKVKLESTGTDGTYTIYATNLTGYTTTEVKIACTGNTDASTVYFDVNGSSTTYNTWDIAIGSATMDNATTINGYTPYYSICANGTDQSWNRYGAGSNTTAKLYDKTCNNSNWNFIPANANALAAAANTISSSIATGKGYKISDAFTSIVTTVTASGYTYSLADAQSLLSVYSSNNTAVIDLAEGYYYIICKDTDRYEYLFADDFYTSNPSNYTLTANAQVTTNNGIWHVTPDGNTLTLVNGQGTTPSIKSKSTWEYASKESNTLEVYTTNIVDDSYYCLYFPSSTLTLNCPTEGHAIGNYRALVCWTTDNYSKADNRWKFEAIDASAEIYSVSITGASGAYLTYTNSDNAEEHAYNGGFFVSASPITADDLAVSAVDGYLTEMEINDTAISVTYYSLEQVFTELTALITEAETVRDMRGVGYPLTTSTAYSTLNDAITAAKAMTKDNVTADALTTLQEALSAYKSEKSEIQMPEDGKAYTFTAVLKDGHKQLMYYDAENQKFDVLTSVLLSDIPDATEYNLSSLVNGITIASATASSSQSGEGIELSYDGDASTIWHSYWYNTTSPITITYTFSEASHLDYFIYTPRTDNINGRFGEITVSYATSTNPNTFVEYGSADFNESATASLFSFGANGIDDVLSVRITIKSSASSDDTYFLGSCAEIAFYASEDETASEIDTYFTSATCEALKENVTARQVANIQSPLLRTLAKKLLAGDYSKEFRVADFGCYESLSSLQSRLKTNNCYDPYENPTGIYFTEGDTIVVFADGISNDYPVSLYIQNFSNADQVATEGQSGSTYALTNGANVIVPSNRGNGYVSYYNDDYENAPTVRLHFAMANEVGYFDATKDMTNDDWKRYLVNANAVGADIIDFVTQRLHVAVPYANALTSCPENAEKLALIYDSLVYRERQIMGLGLEGNTAEPKNHQFARPVNSGMYADGTGAAAAFGSFNEWCNPDDFGFWGLGHELGHNNQIYPGFCWSGCGETTNNIYAAWVEHNLGSTKAYGNGYHRLEDEITGVDTYESTRGGRFEAYLEEGVRKGTSWQLQDGPDYHGNTAESKTVTGADENGSTGETVTTTSRNYDHFVKVIPFWQLELYTIEAGANPRAFGDFIQTYRDGFDTSTYNTNGKQQIEMIRRFCNAAQINFLDFFETAGILKPINAYIEDYTAGWNIITEAMCTAVKEEIEAKGYPEAPAGLNFINAYNWTIFRDKVALDKTVAAGTGCNTGTTDRIRITNASWPGAVAYKTYDASGNLLHISMYGLGDSQMSSTYTYVLFPSSESPSYITAVGYDGSEVTCYGTAASAPAKTQSTK